MRRGAVVLPLSLALMAGAVPAPAGEVIDAAPPAAVAIGSVARITALPPLPVRQRPPEAAAGGGLRVDAAFVTGGQVADLMSTEATLSRCASCGEGNRLVGSRPLRVGSKTATALALTLACHQLRRDGHPRIARSLAIGAGILGGAVSVHNLRAGRRD